MQLDNRYLKEYLDEDGHLMIEINFVDYLMAVISDSGKFYAMMNPAIEYAPDYMISYNDLRDELAKIFRKEDNIT